MHALFIGQTYIDVTFLIDRIPIGDEKAVARDYAVSFAMDTAKSATLTVEWRDGRRTVINGIQPDREYEITAEGASRSAAPVGLNPRTPCA